MSYFPQECYMRACNMVAREVVKTRSTRGRLKYS